MIKSSKKLPDINKYVDAQDAEDVKKHLSYMFGDTIVKSVKHPFKIFILPYLLYRTYKLFKKIKNNASN